MIFQGHKSHIKIHEDAIGGIYTVGVTTRQVTSLQEVYYMLVTGLSILVWIIWKFNKWTKNL